MPENEGASLPLNAGAQRIAELAAQKQQQGKHAQSGTHHWLLALLERHWAMAEAMAQGQVTPALLGELRGRLQQGDLGQPLDQATVVRQASERAQARGRTQVSERDLTAIVLTAAGYAVAEEPAATAATGRAEAPLPGAPAAGGSARPTPTLEQFGRDLTREAQAGKLPPLVGRTEEIDLVIETLCRRTKRNPVLVGPAGVGKTAIAEGLAQRIARGEVPEPLRGVRLIAVQPSALVAGASMFGEIEKRARALLAEASQPGILLFIDEVHSIIGAGGREGTGDFASLLKPALARGDMACIGATTDDEYRRFIEPDAALERRFQPIRVQELTPEQTLDVLASLRDVLSKLRGVQVPDDVLRWLVEFAGEALRNRYFPDKAVDLLEQCVAYAVTQRKEALALADAQVVAQRMIGMPWGVGDRLNALREALSRSALLPQQASDLLLNRLEVTMRGLDLRPARPNVVVLLLGDASANSGPLAASIAGTMFGGEERVVEIDLSRFVENEDVTMLIGSARGYVGYGEALPLHRVVQMPWCVLRLDNLHACHPAVLEVVTQALAAGFFTDSTGKRIYLSDAVVLLTAPFAIDAERGIGFRQADSTTTADARQAAEKTLGEGLLAQCDLVCAEVATSDAARRQWLENHLLLDLAERYRKKGVHLHWDESVINWMLDHREGHANQRDWERLVDDWLSPPLVRYLSVTQNEAARSVRVRFDGDAVQIDPIETSERSE